MIARETDSGSMRAHRDRHDIFQCIAKHAKRKFDLRPVVTQLPPRDVDELIEDLDTCDAAPSQAVGSSQLLRIRRRGVDQNVGVEECLQRSLASSRSNL